MDAYIDIFNVLAAVATRYVDPEGSIETELGWVCPQSQIAARNP